jgi:hypothetical protein
MIWGMTTETFTLVHVLLSLIGIGAGLIAAIVFLSGRRLPVLTAIFLAATTATSVTGFGFPFDRLMPSHTVAIVSLAILAVAIAARYWFRLTGRWRPIFLVCCAAALYLNVFVGVTQAFLKVPALHAMAPQRTEAPFLMVQVMVLLVSIGLTLVAARQFRGEAS